MDTTSMPDNIPTIIFDDTPRARRTDNLNSHAAADGTAKSIETSYLRIERALAAQSPMTAQEIVQYIRIHMGWVSESRVTTAMGELLRYRTVEVAGTRVNPSGYKATAYRLRDEVNA